MDIRAPEIFVWRGRSFGFGGVGFVYAALPAGAVLVFCAVLYNFRVLFAAGFANPKWFYSATRCAFAESFSGGACVVGVNGFAAAAGNWFRNWRRRTEPFFAAPFPVHFCLNPAFRYPRSAERHTTRHRYLSGEIWSEQIQNAFF